MKIYVASSWRNARQPEVVKALREAGHEVYDFRNPRPGDNGFAWASIDSKWQSWNPLEFMGALSHPLARKGFAFDFNAMQWADAIVMVQPCGRSAALELGWGVGAGKRTAVLLAPEQEPELMLKMAERLCLSVEEVIAYLDEAGR